MTAPSGIAKLRESVDQSGAPPSDPMNIDEFVFPSSGTSPTDLSPSPPADLTSPSTNAVASAIPIKTKKEMQDQLHANFPPSAPIEERRRNREFDYVQRRVRKTSIDETRVILLEIGTARELLTGDPSSPVNGRPSSLRRYIRRLRSRYPMIPTGTCAWGTIPWSSPPK